MCAVLEVPLLSKLIVMRINRLETSRMIIDRFPASPLTKFEADRRAFLITVNSFGTDLSGADRSALYPCCGKLAPDGLRLLAKAEDHEQVKAVADCYPVSGTH